MKHLGTPKPHFTLASRTLVAETVLAVPVDISFRAQPGK